MFKSGWLLFLKSIASFNKRMIAIFTKKEVLEKRIEQSNIYKNRKRLVAPLLEKKMLKSRREVEKSVRYVSKFRLVIFLKIFLFLCAISYVGCTLEGNKKQNSNEDDIKSEKIGNKVTEKTAINRENTAKTAKTEKKSSLHGSSTANTKSEEELVFQILVGNRIYRLREFDDKKEEIRLSIFARLTLLLQELESPLMYLHSSPPTDTKETKRCGVNNDNDIDDLQSSPSQAKTGSESSKRGKKREEHDEDSDSDDSFRIVHFALTINENRYSNNSNEANEKKSLDPNCFYVIYTYNMRPEDDEQADEKCEATTNSNEELVIDTSESINKDLDQTDQEINTLNSNIGNFCVLDYNVIALKPYGSDVYELFIVKNGVSYVKEPILDLENVARKHNCLKKKDIVIFLREKIDNVFLVRVQKYLEKNHVSGANDPSDNGCDVVFFVQNDDLSISVFEESEPPQVFDSKLSGFKGKNADARQIVVKYKESPNLDHGNAKRRTNSNNHSTEESENVDKTVGAKLEKSNSDGLSVEERDVFEISVEDIYDPIFFSKILMQKKLRLGGFDLEIIRQNVTAYLEKTISQEELRSFAQQEKKIYTGEEIDCVQNMSSSNDNVSEINSLGESEICKYQIDVTFYRERSSDDLNNSEEAIRDGVSSDVVEDVTRKMPKKIQDVCILPVQITIIDLIPLYCTLKINVDFNDETGRLTINAEPIFCEKMFFEYVIGNDIEKRYREPRIVNPFAVDFEIEKAFMGLKREKIIECITENGYKLSNSKNKAFNRCYTKFIKNLCTEFNDIVRLYARDKNSFYRECFIQLEKINLVFDNLLKSFNKDKTPKTIKIIEYIRAIITLNYGIYADIILSCTTEFEILEYYNKESKIIVIKNTKSIRQCETVLHLKNSYGCDRIGEIISEYIEGLGDFVGEKEYFSAISDPATNKNTNNEFEKSSNKIQDSINEVVNGNNLIENTNNEIEDGNSEIINTNNEFEDSNNEIGNSKKEIINSNNEIEKSNNLIEKSKKEFEKSNNEFEDSKKKL
ncbi:hypothetical protein EDEG_02039 [Edhazardia aedis USNM 41457]|uniref:Uncharacterized protein n=1 Tax=Edhazardia aedis (strain USNM 41457) TaxID=1003232 RepID=J9DQQ0_EDHAE|nr:hypothetical protein EDEG_02039 [Edhazardia aedis USNM 41457]|eukprot:EJW03642.1 hypothetical protein EDEG_02039 [Edhazardia aedis USNM 41457]